MSDLYGSVASSPIGKKLVSALGLPNPVDLRRYQPGGPILSGHMVFTTVGAASTTPVGEAIINAATNSGVEVLGSSEEAPNQPGALVVDVSGATEPDDLIGLQEFFGARLRGLRPSGRVIVVGCEPQDAGSTNAHITQRSLEGFARSLGKEIGRGSTVNLVYVRPGGEKSLTSTLMYLLSGRSAYVTGQVIRVGAAVDSGEPALDPMKPLDGKVALVTGSSRGIGASIADVLARDGATVIGVDIPTAGSDLMNQARKLNGSYIALDVTAVDAGARLARHAQEEHNGLDIVVHNAGITRDKRLVNMGKDRWNATMNVNLLAPMRITQHLLENNVLRSGGRIVGVSSIAGIAGNTGQTNYGASKAGVIGFVDTYSEIAASAGVTVNAVAPGFIETQMTAAIPMATREVGRRINSLSQGGQPQDVAETIAWLSQPGSGGVNGLVLRVCGQSLLGA